MNIFYMVWSPQGGYTELRYENEDDVVVAAERLAGLTAGKEFYVLKAITMSKTEKPVKTIFLSEPLPF